MMRYTRTLAALAALCLAARGSVGAQTPANDPSARLKEVLPADVADRVLSKIAEARARELPAQALENRALKFAAKGVAPADIERSVSEQSERMGKAKDALESGRGRKPSGEEVEAGAEALRQGVDGKAVSALAKTAPSGRSLVVPLYVIGGLVERGLRSDAALKRVQDKLTARASDAELEGLPAQAAAGQANRPAETGRELAGVKSGGHAASGPPAGVPANGGRAARPAVSRPPSRRP
jgi:hypothetical protein